jgi:antitoxin (DNA-binding transcriptional repressor) of toxin-antitoxin stability system
MKKTSISMTEASRSFAECVNRVRHHNMTFVLLKKGTPVAQLVPAGRLEPDRKMTSVRELAAALREFDLSPDEARAWNRDLRRARRMK